jgi:cytochrome c oxidase subunit 4
MALSRIASRLGNTSLKRLVAIPIRNASETSALPATQRDKYYPKLGNRDIVGYGWNGYPTYIDRQEFPCPPVRFRENSADVVALREKEKGDWNALTLDEKRALYRASFAQTFAEMNAPTGEWKPIFAIVLLGLSVTAWFLVYIKHFILPPLPRTITEEWKQQQLELMIKQRQNAVIGVASQWDYKDNRWK